MDDDLSYSATPCYREYYSILVDCILTSPYYHSSEISLLESNPLADWRRSCSREDFASAESLFYTSGMRKTFRFLLIAVFIEFSYVQIATAAGIEGYASATSIPQGGTIAFHLSGNADSFALEVRRKGLTELIGSAIMIGSGFVTQSTTPANASVIGCNWPVSYQFTAPVTWPSGVYSANFTTSGNAHTEIPFVVRAANPGSASKILYQLAVNTSQAYNKWGGKSLYDFNSTGQTRASSVSFDRPLDPTVNFFDEYDYPFIKWLEMKQIPVEFCTSVDLHSDSTLLGNYQLLLIVGHDEYWSAPMRDHVEAFTRSGGNVAIFGGNTCWWQVRFASPSGSAPNRQLVCYKYNAGNTSDDPVADVQLKTTNWYDTRYANRPENRMTGLSSRIGAAWEVVDPPRPGVDFIVKLGDSWVFEGTGAGIGTGFGSSDLGQSDNIVGYETDAAEFVNGNPPRVTGADGTAYNFSILATADATSWNNPNVKPGWALLGFFQNNGTVFDVGTTDWPHGLRPVIAGGAENMVAHVTENVVRRLSRPRTVFEKATLAVYSYHVVRSDGGWRFYFDTDPFVASGWLYDGPAFYAHREQIPNTVPVYRHYVAQRDGLRFHLSTNPDLTAYGWTNGGIAFYAYSNPSAHAFLAPVYSYYFVQSDGGYRFYYSTDASVGSGWINGGVAFYAFVTNPAP